MDSAVKVSPADLKALSGYSGSSGQLRWLRINGIGHTTDRYGHPVTTWHLVEMALTGKKDDENGYHAPKVRTA